MPNDNYYIPGVPQNLQGILYTPRTGVVENQRLRRQFAGNPAAQQELVVDDRYHQGKGMMEASPLAALATFVGSVPYDAAKLAYFHSPRPVQKLIEQGTEKLFPGEGFNLQTTSRPSRRGTGAYLHGMAEGAYGLLRQQLVDLNNKVFDDKTIDRVRAFTARQNYGPNLQRTFLEDRVQDERAFDLSSPEAARSSVKNWATRQAITHALDPVGTSLKALSTLLQTANPDFDTRPQFDDWMPDDRLHLQAIAPGMKPIRRMTAEEKAKQNAQLSQIMSTWGQAQPTQFPIRQVVQVPK